MVLRRSVLLYEIIIRIIGTDTDLAVRGVDIPVTAVHHRVVGADGLAVFLLPCHGGVVTGAVDEPEGTHRSLGTQTLGSFNRIVQTVDIGDAAHVDKGLERHVAVVGDAHGLFLLGALLRVDQDHAEGGLRTVDGGGGGVLQDGDRLDVIRVDVVQRGDLDVVEQDQRGGGTVVGTDLAADADDGVGTDLSRTDTDVQARSSTLETTSDIGDRTALELLGCVDRGDGTGQVRFLLLAETDDDGVLEHLRIFCQDDVNDPAAGHGDLLGLVADAGELKCTIGGYVDGIGTVDVRRGSVRRSNNDHVGTYDRLVVLIDHLTGDGNVLSQQRSR